MTLWQIDERLGNVLAALETCEDEGQTREALLTALGEVEGELEEKLDGWAAAISQHEAVADARAAEAKRLATLAERDRRRATQMRSVLKEFLEARNIRTVRTPRYELSVVRHGGLPPVAVSIPVEELPERYRRTRIVVSADLDALRDALTRGEAVEGVSLGERGTSLRLR